MARCSKCGAVQIVDRKDYKHGEKVTCDCCKTEAKVYDVRSNTNYYYHGEQLMVTLLQKSGNVIVFSRYIANCDIVDQRELYKVVEVEVRIVDGKEIFSYSKDWQGLWAQKRLFMSNTGSWFHLRQVDFFPDSFDKWLSTTDLKYSCLGKWLDKKNDYELDYFVMARKYPFLEQLYKGGMIGLFREFIEDHSGKVATIGLLKRQRGFVKKHMLDMGECRDVRSLEIHGLPISDLSVKLVRMYNAELVIEAKEIIGNCVTMKQIAKYVSRLNARNWHYKDYLNLMVKIGTPVDNQTVFPKDVKKAHDDATDKFNAIKYEIENKTYQERFEAYSKLAMESDKLAIVVPSELQDILHEGQELHHCVGSYVDKVAQGKTIILFVRKVDDLSTPFYTMEYRDNRIIQCMGLRHANMTPEVKKFTEEWLKEIKKPKKKVKAQNEQRANA